MNRSFHQSKTMAASNSLVKGRRLFSMWSTIVQVHVDLTNAIVES